MDPPVYIGLIRFNETAREAVKGYCRRSIFITKIECSLKFIGFTVIHVLHAFHERDICIITVFRIHLFPVARIIRDNDGYTTEKPGITRK